MTPDAELELDGVKQPIFEWALDYGITSKIILQRLKRGWSVEDAIKKEMSGRARLSNTSDRLRSLARLHNVTLHAINGRLRHGMTLAEALNKPLQRRKPRKRPGEGQNFPESVGDRRGEARARSARNRDFAA